MMISSSIDCRGVGEPARRAGYNTVPYWIDSEMKRILLVDDETFFLQSLDRVLQSTAMEVKKVETGTEALHEVAAAPYHLCFLDICLPDLDGIEVLKRITEISPRTKVIMMTAGNITMDMQRIIEEYAFMFLAKPFDLFQARLLAKSILDELAA
jgi:DNA-binding NtrC family response regulator